MVKKIFLKDGQWIVFFCSQKEQKRYFTGGAVALGSAHTSFSFDGVMSIKFLMTPFLRQSNLPLFAPFLCKVGIWTFPHFCVKTQKNKRGIESRSLKLTHKKRKRINVPFILIGFVVEDDEDFGRPSVQKMVFHAHNAFRKKSVFQGTRKPNIS
ncbi:hypothetical protein [Enterococcus sp. AZ091]|uniref:hypothetical protein n=1 Tax=Enterococcus sp. AZ091 TaxID=2774720 RepID=UPI003F691EF0